MNLSIQVISDTHIERITYPFEDWNQLIKISAEIIILSGDIGNPFQENYWSFLEFISKRCRLVFLITGNHEYWNNNKEKTDTHIRVTIKNKNLNNIRFLQRDYVIIDNTVFLGCTLWSYIPEYSKNNIEKWASDFFQIPECKNSEIFNDWHYQDLRWLIHNICDFNQKGYQVIVITHYSPNFELNFNPKYEVNWTSFAFSTDLSFIYPYVKCWIYGHTHFDYNNNHIYKIKDYDTSFISNQRGYPNSVKKLYDPKFKFYLGSIKDTLNYQNIQLNFNFDEKYIKQIQDKLENWIKNNKKIF